MSDFNLFYKLKMEEIAQEKNNMISQMSECLRKNRDIAIEILHLKKKFMQSNSKKFHSVLNGWEKELNEIFKLAERISK